MSLKYVLLAFTLGARAVQLTPTPTPAPGVTYVAGEVSVKNEPVVLARQDGVWTVDCRSTSDNRTLTPVVQPGQRYTIVFSGGVREEHLTPLQAPEDGWFPTTGGRRFNLAAAISVEEER